ncbi:alkaline phosphatase D family protein [Robiginitalea aurantiaca]|uniref:Alkaline phosphatase D family protein n=1 Tax=Robiginitalea aurantiaca TaxID=3056915 RepID=A0ABT7WGL1_9FLAO|nr:alkaline phosphatase D family protein [Robiginitalea aurantiaca]MDM9632051.1 alkaline phosphatase D family protein [Robiginitalea aurantiaca]
MKLFHFQLLLLLILLSCKPGKDASAASASPERETFRIAFGSCNDTGRGNLLWDDILALDPDLWIWGGDNVYADTAEKEKLREYYAELKKVPGYSRLKAATPVIGTWDDHDYGLNDGGAEFTAREVSQQEFMDFMDVPADSPRRQREGIYASHTYRHGKGSVKILVLDTRCFRTALREDPTGDKRYLPHTDTSVIVSNVAVF